MKPTKEFFRKRLDLELSSPTTHRSGSPATGPAYATPGDLLGITDDREFLAAAYRQILGREPDLPGLIGYLEALQHHTPRRVILKRLADSDEARARGMAFARTIAEKIPKTHFWERIGNRFLSAGHNLVKRVLLSRFDSLDYRLSFLLQETAERQEQLSAKIDRSTLTVMTDLAEAKRSLARLKAHQRRIEKELSRLHKTVENRDGAAGQLHELREQVKAVQGQIRHSSVRVVEAGGFLIGVPAEEWRLAAFLQSRGLPDPGMVKLFESVVQPGMVVVDVGANLGVFTLTAARKAGPSCRIFSFEPAPATLALLNGNIQLNGFLETHAIRTSGLAVADTEGAGRLAVFADRSGHNTLYWADDGTETVGVRITTLDAALAQEERVDVVKIDAEGAEPRILRGMAGILAANPRIKLFIEFAPTLLERGGESPADFLHELRDAGLQARRIDDLTGEIRETSDAELLAAFSANLYLERRS